MPAGHGTAWLDIPEGTCEGRLIRFPRKDATLATGADGHGRDDRLEGLRSMGRIQEQDKTEGRVDSLLAGPVSEPRTPQTWVLKGVNRCPERREEGSRRPGRLGTLRSVPREVERPV